MNSVKKLAAYCRVSTDRQKNEHTIEVQKRLIKEWAASNNSLIVKWYCDDGWSGDILERPQLDLLLDEIDKNLWDGVVFFDRDRVARNVAYQEFVFRELRDKNIELFCVTNPMAKTDEDNALQQVLAVFAELDRKRTIRKLMQGKIHKAKNGKIVGHSAAYGYRYIPKSGNKDGYYQIYEPEAGIVRMIFSWVADEGFSMRQVIKELYKKKIPSPKGNDTWVKSTIERLLKRQDYIGTNYYNKSVAVVPKSPQNNKKYKKIKKSSRKLKPREEWIAIPVPKIIDGELYRKARKCLEENKTDHKRNRKYDYLLSGKVFCECGHRRVGDGVKDHNYYRSAERIYRFPKRVSGKCKCQGVNARILDTMVWNKLVTLLSQKDIVLKQAERWKAKYERTRNYSQSSKNKLETALEKLSSEENKLLKAYSKELITFQQFEESVKGVKSKKELLQGQLQSLQDKIPDEEVSLDSFTDICDTLFHRVKYADTAKKREYVKKLVVSIIVGERRKALVNGRIPLIAQGQNIQDVLISRDSWSS